MVVSIFAGIAVFAEFAGAIGFSPVNIDVLPLVTGFGGMIRGGITTTGRDGAFAGSIALDVNPTEGGGITTAVVGLATVGFSAGFAVGLATGLEGNAFLIGLRNSMAGFPRPLAGAGFMRLADLAIGGLFLADRAGATFFIGGKLLPSPSWRGKGR